MSRKQETKSVRGSDASDATRLPKARAGERARVFYAISETAQSHDRREKVVCLSVGLRLSAPSNFPLQDTIAAVPCFAVLSASSLSQLTPSRHFLPA